MLVKLFLQLRAMFAITFKRFLLDRLIRRCRQSNYDRWIAQNMYFAEPYGLSVR